MKRAYEEMAAREFRGPSRRELAEMALDFDAMQDDGADWWMQQDHDMQRAELEAIEVQATIEDERRGGAW